MKNLSKKILGIILVILILLSANLSIAATESELNSQKEDNQQKIEESQEKQEEIQQAKGTAMEEVNQLNTQIDSYQSQINSLDSQISEANKKIEEEKLSAKLILQVHDELIIDTPFSEVEKVKVLLKECMENAVELKVPLTVSIGAGKNWLEAK